MPVLANRADELGITFSKKLIVLEVLNGELAVTVIVVVPVKLPVGHTSRLVPTSLTFATGRRLVFEGITLKLTVADG